jgi:hypothetical protein
MTGELVGVDPIYETIPSMSNKDYAEDLINIQNEINQIADKYNLVAPTFSSMPKSKLAKITELEKMKAVELENAVNYKDRLDFGLHDVRQAQNLIDLDSNQVFDTFDDKFKPEWDRINFTIEGLSSEEIMTRLRKESPDLAKILDDQLDDLYKATGSEKYNIFKELQVGVAKLDGEVAEALSKQLTSIDEAIDARYLPVAQEATAEQLAEKMVAEGEEQISKQIDNPVKTTQGATTKSRKTDLRRRGYATSERITDPITGRTKAVRSIGSENVAPITVGKADRAA